MKRDSNQVCSLPDLITALGKGGGGFGSSKKQESRLTHEFASGGKVRGILISSDTIAQVSEVQEGTDERTIASTNSLLLNFATDRSR